MFNSSIFIVTRGMSKNSKGSIKFISDYALFRRVLDDANKIVVLTGAGISAESGIPVFRGPGGLWRKYKANELAIPAAFMSFPSLVWQFYSYRREIAFKAEPNKAHLALAKYEEKCIQENRKFSVITQNVDGLHSRAGSQKVIELHGALRKVKCTKCHFIYENLDVPICDTLEGLGNSDNLERQLPLLPISDLPKCIKCSSLLRPYIVWFGEFLDPDVMEEYQRLIEECHLKLNPDLKEEQVIKHLNENGFHDVKCVRVDSRRPDVYSSFRISVPREQVDSLKKPEIWPEGTKVNPFLFRLSPPTAQKL